MTPAELPENWQELIAGYVLNDLSPQEHEEFERLLVEHPHLKEEVQVFTSTFAALPEALHLLPSPPALKAAFLERALSQAVDPDSAIQPTGAVMSALEEIGHSSPNAGTASSRYGWRWRWLGSIGVAAIVAIVLLGRQNLLLRQELELTQTQSRDLAIKLAAINRQLDAANRQLQDLAPLTAALKQPETQLFSLQGTGTTSTASGSLMILPNRSMMFVVNNLPPLEKDQVYRMWAKLPDQASPSYCGQFTIAASGIMRWSTPSPRCGQPPTQLLVTVDTKNDPITRSGPLVMQSSIASQ